MKWYQIIIGIPVGLLLLYAIARVITKGITTTIKEDKQDENIKGKT